MRAFFALLLVSAAGFAQCFKLAEVNAEKPEGQLLQQIGQEQDQAKRLQLMEKFVTEYPKHEAIGSVYEQMQAAYIKAGDMDKALAVSEKVVPLGPECVELSHQALKAAEAKKDAAAIVKWSAQTAATAEKVAATPKPADADEAESWKQRVDYAKQVGTYAGYALYAAALQTPDPAKKIELLETLEKTNPKSEYLPKSYGTLFLAYRQTKAEPKALALAERVLATDQSDEDMLLVVAGNYFQTKKSPEKVHEYCEKVAQLMGSKAKPEGVADADWNTRKKLMTGTAHFISGSLYYNESKFSQTDKELREAVPLLDNAAMKAEALYYLGFANYKMEKAQDAVTFYRACGAIASRFKASCNKNIVAIRSEYTGIK